MRPVALSISAFGPYAQTQVVDFRELRDKRFFLIHGPTGAGKTSVLDAMTFALYGATSGEERSGKQMRCLQSDRGTLTEVTFDFTVGREAYRVWRQPEQERPKQRGEGTTVEKPKAALWRRTACGSDAEEGEVLATKIGEVDARIREILGFDCDQFRQVVVLPQGRFREVLSADVKSREVILRQLFRTERFARITDHLKQRRNESRRAIEDTFTKRATVLEGAGVSSREELEALVESAAAALTAAETLHATAEARADAARAALQVGRAAVDVIREAAAARSALEAIEATQEQMERDRVDLSGARAALVVQPAFEARRRAREALARAVTAVAEAERRLPELEAAHADACEAAGAAEAAHAADLEIERLEAELAGAERLVVDARRVGTARAAEERAHTLLESARSEHEAAQATAAQAAASLAEIERRWREERAAAMAATLVAGEACPVCGSPDHPAPAVAPHDAVPDAELDGARLRASTAEGALAATRERLANAESGLAEAARVRASEVETAGAAASADVEHLTEKAAELRTEIARRRDAVARAARDVTACRERRERAVEALAGARATLESARDAHATAAADAQAAEAAFDGALAEADFDGEDAFIARRRTPVEIDALEGRVAEFDRALAAARDRDRRAAEAAKTVTAAPDIAALEAAAAAAAEESAVTGRDAGATRTTLEGLQAALATIDRFERESAEATADYEVLARLADVADGSNELNLSLQRFVLGSYLDEVLAHANHRLQRMTGGRYRLERSTAVEHRGRAAGLALSVFDEQAGKSRPADTLSGGEGFLASLALALGLAEAVQAHAGGVKLETIFIDEGFGTLDPEALDTAITTLLELAGVAAEQGRLVGIISHVPELRQRIDARLEITPSDGGSSARFVV